MLSQNEEINQWQSNFDLKHRIQNLIYAIENGVNTNE